MTHSFKEYVKIIKIYKVKCKTTEYLTLSHPVPRSGNNTELPWNNNISKTVKLNIAFTNKSFKEYSISFLMICRLIEFALLVLQLLMLKVCGIIGISKIETFIFPVLKRLSMNYVLDPVEL